MLGERLCHLCWQWLCGAVQPECHGQVGVGESPTETTALPWEALPRPEWDFLGDRIRLHDQSSRVLGLLQCKWVSAWFDQSPAAVSQGLPRGIPVPSGMCLQRLWGVHLECW